MSLPNVDVLATEATRHSYEMSPDNTPVNSTTEENIANVYNNIFGYLNDVALSEYHSNYNSQIICNIDDDKENGDAISLPFVCNNQLLEHSHSLRSNRQSGYNVHTRGGPSITTARCDQVTKRHRGKYQHNTFTKTTLRRWLYEHASNPYPTPEEKSALCEMTNIKLTQLNDWFVNARRRMLPKVLNERDTFLNVHDMMQTNIPFSTTITPSSEQNSLFYPTQPHYNYAGWLAELINNNAQISELSIEQLQLQALCLMLPNACNTLVMPTTDDCTDQVLQAYQSTSENANMTTNSLIHDLNVLNNNATSNTSTNTTSIENIAHKNATDVWPTTTCTPHNNC